MGEDNSQVVKELATELGINGAGLDGPRLTDMGNATRLLTLHGEDLRHCDPWKSWLTWVGVYWERDDIRGVWWKARDVAHHLYEMAAEFSKAAAAADEPESQKFADMAIAFNKWGKASEALARISALVDLAKSEPGIAILPQAFDKNPYLLNCLNGTLDLRTGDLRPHSRDDLITKVCPVEYSRDAGHNDWTAFLERVQPDPEIRGFLQRAAGYSLSGLTSEEVLFFCHGGTNTGKSTFLRAVCGALGEYSATADFGTFLKKDRPSGGHNHDIARLAGRRIVVSIEVDSGERLAESLVKQLTGGDVVTASHKFQDSFQFVPAFKLWLAANARPLVSADDAAMWRRILQVPFDQVIPPEERDPQVKATLSDPSIAGPAVLAWAVQGFLAWQAIGLRPPRAVVEATEAYREEVNPVAEFVGECCISDPQAEVSAAHLYAAYLRWAAGKGIRRPLNDAWFGRNLSPLGYTPRKTTGGKRVWIGLGLFADV